MLTWVGPAATSCASSSGPRSRRPARRRACRATGWRTSCCPRSCDAIGDGMTAGHRAARAAIKARRPDLPVGLSHRDRRRPVSPATTQRPRPQARRGLRPLARAGPRRRLRRRAELRADPLRRRRPGARGRQRRATRWARRRAALARGGGAVRPRGQPGAGPGHRARHGHGRRRLRAAFIEPSLRGLLDVIEEGVPVLGYLHWTLMDNFEWIFGYDFHYGLHEVDRITFARTPKPSAAVYAADRPVRGSIGRLRYFGPSRSRSFGAGSGSGGGSWSPRAAAEGGRTRFGTGWRRGGLRTRPDRLAGLLLAAGERILGPHRRHSEGPRLAGVPGVRRVPVAARLTACARPPVPDS